MAAITTTLAASDDLTDEQIELLLTRATARLQQKERDAGSKSTSVDLSFPKLDAGQIAKSYVTAKGEIASVDSSNLLNDKQRTQAGQIRKIEDPITVKKVAEEKKKANAGQNWYNLPKTDLTPELKRDLQLIKMRGVLDPHRHYKKDNGKMKAPEYSQVGTIIEGSAEFYSGRIDNKQRKRTFVEEVLAGERETGRFKRKYGELQSGKMNGKKAFYKVLKAKRHGGVKKGSG